MCSEYYAMEQIVEVGLNKLVECDLADVMIDKLMLLRSSFKV